MTAQRPETKNLHIPDKHPRIVARLLFFLVLTYIFLGIALKLTTALLVTEEKNLSPKARFSTGCGILIDFFLAYGIYDHNDTSVKIKENHLYDKI